MGTVRSNPPPGAVFRTRETYYKLGGMGHEIREKSGRGEWIVYGVYETRAERMRAWQDLANTGLYVMEWNQDIKISEEEGMAETAIIPEVVQDGSGEGKAFEEWKDVKKTEEMEYEIFKANMEAKIHGAAGRESMERLIRVIHLRQVKERLTPLGRWAKWCQEAGIEVRTADYEITKLGDWKDDLLTKFVSYAGVPFNKIRQLTNGDLQKLQVTAGDNQILVNGETVPLEKEEVQFVIDSLQEEARKAELKAEEEKKELADEAAAAKKALKKVEKELKKIRGEAKGMTDEEIGYIEQMDAIRLGFHKAVTEFKNMGLGEGDALTEAMLKARQLTLKYMQELVAGIDQSTN